MPTTLQFVLDTLRTRAHEQYGNEAVTQLEHALQCATLAAEADSAPSLVVASLLHDFGHLIHNLGEDHTERGIDDRHEHRALPVLKQLFGTAVTEPIRMHVNAKRYLCAVRPDYWASLSKNSQQSLELQGGIYSPTEAEAFIQQPYAQAAANLRIWDDFAKVPNQKTPELEHFIPMLEACLNP